VRYLMVKEDDLHKNSSSSGGEGKKYHVKVFSRKIRGAGNDANKTDELDNLCDNKKSKDQSLAAEQ